MNGNISDFFPILQEKVSGLYEVSVIIAIVMATGGFIASIYRAQLNPCEFLNSVVKVAITSLVIANFPEWSNVLQDIAYGVLDTLDADPSKSHENFARYVAGVSEEGESNLGFWDVMFSQNGGFGQAILYATVFFLSKVASAIMWLFFVLQQTLVQVQIALAPVFIAMFLIGPLNSVAIRFQLGFIALLLWPLGWGISSLLTDTILELAATNKIYQIADDVHLGGPQTLFFTIVISIWVLLSTIAAPLIVHKVLTTGVNVGSALLTSVGSGLSQGSLFGTSAGVTAAMNGGSSVTVGGSAALGALGGGIGGALGSNGVMISSAIGLGAAAAITRTSEATPSDYSSQADELANQARSKL